MGGGGGINFGGGAIGSTLGGMVMGPVGSVAGGLAGGMPGMFGGGGGGPGSYGTYMPMPERPDWGSNLDDKTGLLKSNLTTQWGPDVTSDQRGMDAYRNMALGTGPSPWASAQLDKQKLDEQGLNQSAQEQNASAGAQARSGLASKYGLSSGANASLAKQQMRDQAKALQNVGFQGAQARAGIGAQDATNRQGFLQGLPGQDLAQANLAMQNKTGNLQQQQYNIGNALNETTQKRAADLNAYNQQMSVYGANKNANAMQAQGNGGKK